MEGVMVDDESEGVTNLILPACVPDSHKPFYTASHMHDVRADQFQVYYNPPHSSSSIIIYIYFLQRPDQPRILLSKHTSLSASNSLELPPHQVKNHLFTRNPSRSPQRRHIKRTSETVREPEEQHGRNPPPCILQRKARLVHLVLLDGAALKVVHAALRIDLWLEGSRCVRELCAFQDVEIVVRCVTAGVAFGANGRTCSIVSLLARSETVNKG